MDKNEKEENKMWFLSFFSSLFDGIGRIGCVCVHGWMEVILYEEENTKPLNTD